MIQTNNSKKQISIGAVISYIAIFVNICATLFYTPWMKNQIGISNYGLYTLANSLIAMFLLDFGLGSAISAFVSRYRAENNQEAISKLLGLVYKLYLIIDFFISVLLIIFFFCIHFIYKGLTPAEINVFKNIYIIVGLFSIFSFPFSILNGVYNAYEKFAALKLIDLGQKLFSIALVTIVLLFGYGVTMLVLCNALSGLLAVLIKFIVFKVKFKIKANWKTNDMPLLKSILIFSIWTFILGIAQRLTYNIAPSILGAVSDSYQIALYSPASAIAGYFFTFATAINGLFLPTISRKIVEKKDEEILDTMIKVGKFQLVVLGLLYVGFFSVGKEFMSLWMGDEFLPSYYCVLLLAFPTIFEYSQQIAKTTIIAKNKVKYEAIGFLASSILNVVISPFLAKKYGVYGVSVGILITSMLNLIYINIIYIKVLKLDMAKFYKSCYLRILLPLVLGMGISFFTVRFVPLNGWLGLIVKSCIVAFIFLLLVFIFHLTKYEKCWIFNFLKRKKETNE